MTTRKFKSFLRAVSLLLLFSALGMNTAIGKPTFDRLAFRKPTRLTGSHEQDLDSWILQSSVVARVERLEQQSYPGNRFPVPAEFRIIQDFRGDLKPGQVIVVPLQTDVDTGSYYLLWAKEGKKNRYSWVRKAQLFCSMAGVVYEHSLVSGLESKTVTPISRRWLSTKISVERFERELTRGVRRITELEMLLALPPGDQRNSRLLSMVDVRQPLPIYVDRRGLVERDLVVDAVSRKFYEEGLMELSLQAGSSAWRGLASRRPGRELLMQAAMNISWSDRSRSAALFAFGYSLSTAEVSQLLLLLSDPSAQIREQTALFFGKKLATRRIQERDQEPCWVALLAAFKREEHPRVHAAIICALAQVGKGPLQPQRIALAQFRTLLPGRLLAIEYSVEPIAAACPPQMLLRVVARSLHGQLRSVNIDHVESVRHRLLSVDDQQIDQVLANLPLSSRWATSSKIRGSAVAWFDPPLSPGEWDLSFEAGLGIDSGTMPSQLGSVTVPGTPVPKPQKR